MARQDYLYPVTRIRAMETRLLDRNRVSRMLDVSEPEEILKVLSETEYGAHLTGLESVHDYEVALGRERERVYSLLGELAPEPILVRLLTLPFDIQNLKVILKSGPQGIERYGHLLSELGAVPAKRLEQIFREGKWGELPEDLRGPVNEVLEEPGEEKEPQVVDLILDRSLLDLLYRTARRMRSRFLLELYSRQIDLLNIETFIRVGAMGQDRSLLVAALVEGGSLALDIFTESFGEPISALPGLLAMTEYGELVREGIDYWEERGSLVRFEKLADDFLMEHLKRAKFISFGPEPLIGYLRAKENEIKCLRIILVGKINELPTNVIRERLRDLYV